MCTYIPNYNFWQSKMKYIKSEKQILFYIYKNISQKYFFCFYFELCKVIDSFIQCWLDTNIPLSIQVFSFTKTSVKTFSFLVPCQRNIFKCFHMASRKTYCRRPSPIPHSFIQNKQMKHKKRENLIYYVSLSKKIA